MATLHHLLRKAREDREITLEQAADLIGISGASFSRMENGLSRITTDRLVQLSELYGISASALLDGAIVSRPTTVDLQRLRATVEAVQGVVGAVGASPSPEKLGEAVAEIYRTEIERIIDTPNATFDPLVHEPLIKVMFRE